MKKISITDFQQLLANNHPYSVSIFLSTVEVGKDTRKRETQYRKLVREVLDQLKDVTISKKETESITQQLEKVLTIDDFWATDHSSFAVFATPEMIEYFQLPIEISDFAMVSYRFHLKPLLRVIAQPCEFYLLRLTQKSVELFKGDRYSMEKVDVPNLPQTVAEVTGTETGERNLQFHTGTTSPSGGKRPASYHGNSSWKDDQHKYLEKFLQAIDKVVEKHLRASKSPLILNGTERMLTMYQEVNSYPHLVKGLHLKGNSEDLPLTEVYYRALDLLTPYFIDQEKQTVAKHFAHGDASRFSTDLREILSQARMGKVDTLLVAQGVREWGQFNPDTLQVTYLGEPVPEAHDLLDVACAQTLLNGGKAFVLPPEEIPQHHNVAAVFRY